ncbi:MAG: hypothetical protein IKZ55_11810 [Bacteroidales bacterium]|nr:hypothetical protein [Bacteroidales bacterium]
MEENNKENISNENETVEQKPAENKATKRKKLLKEIWQYTFGLAVWVFIIVFTTRCVKSTIQSWRERKEERRKETVVKRQRICWDDYDYLFAPTENVEDFLVAIDPYEYALDELNGFLAAPLHINRPYNIAWDGDTMALAERHIAPMQMPLDLDLYRTEFLIDSLKQNTELCTDFFDWIAGCIRTNNHINHLNYDYWQKPCEYDAVFGRIVTHLKHYLALDGLHHDRLYEDFCKKNGMEDWFDSPNRIIEVDGAYYCSTKTIENPYRRFEVFVYRLVEEYGVEADKIKRWFNDCPILGDNYENVIRSESVLPLAPTLVRETFLDLEGDTIWLSDLAMEWTIELKEATEDGFDSWDEFMHYLDLEFILEYRFNDYYYLETDYIVRLIRQELLEQPQLFDALVEWMSPTVDSYLSKLDDTEKKIVNEHITHLLDYLHNGSYEQDLVYERLAEPVSPGFAIEYAPEDFIILDGEIYRGLGENPYRWDEMRLFVALQYGVSKEKFERLLVKTTDALNESKQ